MAALKYWVTYISRMNRDSWCGDKCFHFRIHQINLRFYLNIFNTFLLGKFIGFIRLFSLNRPLWWRIWLKYILVWVASGIKEKCLLNLFSSVTWIGRSLMFRRIRVAQSQSQTKYYVVHLHWLSIKRNKHWKKFLIWSDDITSYL